MSTTYFIVCEEDRCIGPAVALRSASFGYGPEDTDSNGFIASHLGSCRASALRVVSDEWLDRHASIWVED